MRLLLPRLNARNAKKIELKFIDSETFRLKKIVTNQQYFRVSFMIHATNETLPCDE